MLKKHEFRTTSGTEPDCWDCGRAASAEVHDVGEKVTRSVTRHMESAIRRVEEENQLVKQEENSSTEPTESPRPALATRTLEQIQAEWREEGSELLKAGKNYEVLILGNRLLLEANLQGEYDAYGRVAKGK